MIEPRIPEDEVDQIPDISYEECLIEIKEINPEMSDIAAMDNCIIIEAVNSNNPSLCNDVSEEFKTACEDQFI